MSTIEQGDMRIGDKARLMLSQWETLLAVVVIIVVIVASVTTDGFFSGLNLSNSLSVMSEKALFVLPLALLVVIREIDISVASTAALSACSAGLVLKAGAPAGATDGTQIPIGVVLLAIVVAVLVGATCGAFNGFLVAILGMPSLVATLGTLALYRGMCYMLLGSEPINTIPDAFINFGNENIPRTYIPLDILPFIILAPIFAVLLHRMSTGRRIYAIGGNPDTAEYSGVRERKIRFNLFLVTGAVSAIAGIINLGRINQATPDAMFGFELDAITIVFLGGISFLGGKGKISGVVWAMLLVVVLRSALQLNNVSSYAQGTAVGVLLIVSLLLSNASQQISTSLQGRRHRGAAPPAPANAEVGGKA